MSTEQFQKIINGGDMWVVVSVMIIIVILQSIFFLREAIKEARKIGISDNKRKSAMRAASITAIGPSLSPVILMLAMSAMLGTPYTWFTLTTVGAARTEFAVASMGAGLAGVDVMSENIGIKAWTYGIWAGVLNSAGWLVFVFLFNHKMEGLVNGLYSRYDPKWIKKLMAGAALALFAYLLCNQLVVKSATNYLAAGTAAAVSLFFSTVLRKHKRLQEVAIGVSMLAGMFVTQLIFGS